MGRSLEYNGGITREQFLFYEMRVVAKLMVQGLSRDEIRAKVKEENLFQYPTEKMILSITGSCIKRIDTLESDSLVYQLAEGDIELAKFINLYAMMRYNAIVWDFMVDVIGEKYRTLNRNITKAEISTFLLNLKEQNEVIANWSDGTMGKIRQVLFKLLLECGFVDSIKSETINNIYLYPELEEGIKENGDTAALAAFNHFE